MTHKECLDAIEHIQAQLDKGYIDLGYHDYDEIDIIKSAMECFLLNNRLLCENLERRKYGSSRSQRSDISPFD